MQGGRTVRLPVNHLQCLLLDWVVAGFAKVAAKVVFISVPFRRTVYYTMVDSPSLTPRNFSFVPLF